MWAGLPATGEQASEAVSSYYGRERTSADYISGCKSVGKITTNDYGMQPGYVCGVVLTDGYKGPVCFIWRDDGEVLVYNRGKCGDPNDPTE